MSMPAGPAKIALRERLSESQNHRCAYCGRCIREGATLDHLQCDCHGGTHTYDNCVAACLSCNQERGNMGAGRYWRTRHMRRAA